MPYISTEDLPKYFAPKVDEAFATVGIHNAKVPAYVTGMLCDFATTDNLFSPLRRFGIKKQSQYIHEMVKEASHAPEGIRQDIFRHIGDFTLFFLGLYPERLEKKGLEEVYQRCGRSSYGKIAGYHDSQGTGLGEVFVRLSDRFDLSVHALQVMRKDLNLQSSPDDKYDLSKLIQDPGLMQALEEL